jgi:tRNA A37 methylthiotransferase MiaB
VDICQKAGFYKAYISMYSDRNLTAAHTAYTDDIPYEVKKARWEILENLVNKPNLEKIREVHLETQMFT